MDPNSKPDENKQMMGGRRHQRKGHKTRKEPNVLKSWRKFVRKVQHEENLSYPKAMKRASKRKSEWQRGGASDDDESPPVSMGPSMGGRRRRSRKQRGGDVDEPEEVVVDDADADDADEQEGGRRRRSRRQRGGNVSDFDGNFNKQYGSVGGSRKRHSRRHRR